MALARCSGHGKPEGRRWIYVDPPRRPLGYPTRSAIVCGREYCSKPGLIWLTKEEFEQYNEGHRWFYFHSDTAKVRLRSKERVRRRVRT